MNANSELSLLKEKLEKEISKYDEKQNKEEVIIVLPSFDLVSYKKKTISKGYFGSRHEAIASNGKKYIVSISLVPEEIHEITRFWRYVKITSNIKKSQHEFADCFPDIFDAFMNREFCCIISEPIKGVSLHSIKSQYKGDVSKVVSLAQKLIEIIGFLYREFGITYRDVRIDNIFVLENGTVRLTPPELARPLNSEVLVTRFNEIIGEPIYASPEEITGNPSTYPLASDIYKIGILMYELYIGTNPFADAQTIYEVFQCKKRGAIRPSKLLPIPKKLEKVILKCLHFYPQKRYQHCFEMIRDLQTIAQQT